MIKKFKHLKKKEKLQVFLLILLIFFLLLISIILTAIVGTIKNTPVTELYNLSSSFNQTSNIYTEDGKLLEKIDSLEYRTVVPLSKMSNNLEKAFISIEDHRFYKHHGLDPIGIASSIAANIKAKSLIRGGSTLTQQLVRNLYLSNEKSINRKISEAYLAFRVEEKLSKKEILEAYLNRINLGQGAYGVEAASQTYFSKSAKDLNISEAALLAGIVKSPANYPPFKSIPEEFLKPEFKIVGSREINGEEMYLVLNDKAFERQKIVLKRMYDLGAISEKEYISAKNFDIISDINPKTFTHHDMSSYSTDCIKSEAAKYLANYYKISLNEAEHKLFTGGYKVYSSIDENMQKNLEDKYKDFLDFIKSGSSKKGAKLLSFQKDEDENIIYNNEIIYFNKSNIFDENFNLKIPKSSYNISQNGDLKIDNRYFKQIGKKINIIDCYDIFENSILRTYDIGFLNVDEGFFEYKKNYLIIDGNFLKGKKDFYKTDKDENLIISKVYYNEDITPSYQPQSASIISDNETGFIKAIVGGLDIKSKNAKILNRAMDSHRTPGSILTPLSVYLPALENGYTLASVFDDVPITTDGYMWPINYYNSFKGLMTLRHSLYNSSNVICAEIIKNLGKDKSREVLSRFNIIKENEFEDSYINYSENPKKNDDTLDALALGNMQIGLSLNEITNMYQTIANDGIKKDTTSIVKITDPNDNVIIDNKNLKNRIINEKTNYLLKDALIGNAKNGNTKGAKISNAEIGAYLGINKNNSDIFLTGFSKKYTVSTWIGPDLPKISLNTSNNLIINFFNFITEDLKDNSKYKREPDYIVKKYVSSKSGKLGTKLTELAQGGYREIFIKNTEPTEYDDIYKKYLICTDSGKLATQYCPYDSVEYRVYFRRKEKYDKDKHYGIYPDDYMAIPKSYCDIHTNKWYKENIDENEKEEENI